MIVELALASAAILVAGAVARAVAAGRARRETERATRRDERDAPEPSKGLRVGDVLLHVGDELWLAGAVELDEEGARLVLFSVPESARATWVLQLDEDGLELVLMRETTEIPEGSVPDRLPLGGRLLSLRKRGRARTRASGEAPSIGAQARYTILADAGGRTAIVVEFEGAPRIALVGDRVERALIDVLPGGAR